jgi:hypothetical protein
MSDFPIYHGITLAQNAYVENFVVEKLVSDPVPVEAGRAWYNLTDKVWKQSTLDATGAVVVRTFATVEELTAAVAALNSTISAEATRATNAENALSTSLANEVSRATTAENTLTTNLANEVTRAQGAEATLTTNLANEVTRAQGAEATLTTNLAAEVTRATAAEATLTTDLVAEITRATAAEATLTTDLAAEVSRATSAEQALDLRINALGSAFNYVGPLSGGADAASAVDLSAIAQKDPGDYYKVSTSGWFKETAASAPFQVNLNDGLVWNLVGGVDIIDNTNSQVNGTASYISVSGSSDNGFVVDVDAAFKARVSTLESGLSTEVAERQSADSALDTRVTTVESQVNGKIGTLTSLTTTEKGTLVGAINELDADLATLNSASTAAINLVRTDYNARRATFASASAATQHTFAHNLNSQFVDFSLWVQRDNGEWRNDVASVKATSANSMDVYLTAAGNVRLTVTSMASL